MSQGSPIIKTRIHRDLLAAVDSSVAGVPRERGSASYTRSTFIVEAVQAKLREESGEPISYVDFVRSHRRKLEREKQSHKLKAPV